MLRYVARRLVAALLSLFVIVSLTFFLMHAIPGDPFLQEHALPKEILQSLRAHHHLDAPWYEQYLHYLKAIATWNLGPSFKFKARTVNEIIAQGFPISAVLGIEALFLAVGGGVLLGVVAAVKQKAWQDRAAMMVAVAGISIPSFLLATFLQYLFSIKLHWFPVARWGSLAHTVLPALSLAALPMAFIARLVRSSMIDVLQSEYLKTARAKGLSTLQTIWRHTLRNASLPVVTYLGPLTANILTGSFVVEKIFGIPGLGQWFVSSVTSRDYTVIMGMTVFYSTILLASVLLVDITYGFLDPRMRRVTRKRVTT